MLGLSWNLDRGSLESPRYRREKIELSAVDG